MNWLNRYIYLFPIIGIVIFIVLYFYSSTLYPGGSQADMHSEGFDWIHNYWCNLTSSNAINGQKNSARVTAITAMLVLCFSLIVFFLLFAKSYSKNRYWKLSIQWSGILAMIFAGLIFTKHHDLMTILSSIFGLVTVIGVIREIFIERKAVLLFSGVACLLLLALNNFIYYSNHWLVTLPLLQKITFAAVLVWILVINFHMLHKRNI